MNKRTICQADASLLLVAIIWGSGFVATKYALAEITPYYLMAFRFTMAALLLLFFFWRRIMSANRKDILSGSIIGFFLFGAFATQTIGLQYIPAGKAAFLTGTNVIIVPFISWILYRTRPDKYSFIASFIAVVGIGLLTLKGSLAMGQGENLILMCSLFFAGHIVSISHFSKKHDPIILAAVQMIFALLLSFIIAAVSREPWNAQNMTASGWTAVFYVGIASSFIAYTLQNVAQKHTTSTHAALILSMESLFATLFGIWLLRESMNTRMFIGCMMILLAIVTAETQLRFFKKNVSIDPD